MPSRERAFFGVAGRADSGVVAHSDANTDPRGKLQRLYLRPGRNAGGHDAAPLLRLGECAAQRRHEGPAGRELLLRAGPWGCRYAAPWAAVFTRCGQTWPKPNCAGAVFALVGG